MSGDHTKYHGTAEVVKDEGEEHMRYDEDYVAGLKARINELEEALEEAVYLLNLTDEDMQKNAGVYRVVTAFEKLQEKDADEWYEKALWGTKPSKREWVGLTDKEIEDISDRIKGDELLVETSTWHVRYARALERKLKEKNTSQEQSEVERLRQVCRNVYEVWAGSEGIPVPETCSEGYLLRLIEQMRDEAKAGLSQEKHA